MGQHQHLGVWVNGLVIGESCLILSPVLHEHRLQQVRNKEEIRLQNMESIGQERSKARVDGQQQNDARRRRVSRPASHRALDAASFPAPDMTQDSEAERPRPGPRSALAADSWQSSG